MRCRSASDQQPVGPEVKCLPGLPEVSMMNRYSGGVESDSDDSEASGEVQDTSLVIPDTPEESHEMSLGSSPARPLQSYATPASARHRKPLKKKSLVLSGLLNESHEVSSLSDSFKSAMGSGTLSDDSQEEENLRISEDDASRSTVITENNGLISDDDSIEEASENEESSNFRVDENDGETIECVESDTSVVTDQSCHNISHQNDEETIECAESDTDQSAQDISNGSIKKVEQVHGPGVSQLTISEWDNYDEKWGISRITETHSSDLEDEHIQASGVNVKTEHDFMASDARDASKFDYDFANGCSEALETSPNQSSLIDLTQSDSSLQNSPEGAQNYRESHQGQRSLEDIVQEQSAVSHDLMVNQNLLDTLNLRTLPDNGMNLQVKISFLQKKKLALDRELQNHRDYKLQHAEFDSRDIKKKPVSTKQTYLDYMAVQVKNEPEYENGGGNFNSGYKHGLTSNGNEPTMPDWGDLPTADTTISNLGKRAMATHVNEKALTVEALAQLHKSLKSCPSEDTYEDDPKYLKVELLPHQKHGLAWMLWREKETPSGGLLADDMGLGKTISMISLILKDMEHQMSDSEDDSEDGSPWMSSKHSKMVKGGTLVVCPASVLNQWEAEIHKRVKKRYLTVELYHGPKREKKPRRLAKADIVITTYALVSRESGVDTGKNAFRKEQGPLFQINWKRVILDEAHMVRNHKSQMALGVCELVSKHRWCLTGTPIQNKELDLYALLKFLRCSPFDDLTVWKRWVDNKNAAGMQRLNTMMKSLMLRRTKEQLSDKGDLKGLPDKTFEIIDVHLDPEELEVYEKIAEFSQTLFAQFLSQRAEKQQAYDVHYGVSRRPVWEQGETADNQFTTTAELAAMHRKMKGLTDIKTHQILVLLLRLRQICCHPGLVKKMLSEGDIDFDGVGAGVEDETGLDVDLFNLMNNLNINESDFEEEKHPIGETPIKSRKLSESDPVFSFDRPSAKIRAVLDLIQEKLLDSDEKAIIVSQWTSMLDIVAESLKQIKVKFDLLTGKVPVDKRQEIVHDFNKAGRGPQILLLSLTAGGVGLNLIGGNHLLLIDVHWNPQLEAQACDRIYRIGQKKDVYVYKFITINTIEERIKALQDFKLQLADNVMTGTRNTQASKLTLDDLKMLFSVPSPAATLPPASAPLNA